MTAGQAPSTNPLPEGPVAGQSREDGNEWVPFACPALVTQHHCIKAELEAVPQPLLVWAFLEGHGSAWPASQLKSSPPIPSPVQLKLLKCHASR